MDFALWFLIFSECKQFNIAENNERQDVDRRLILLL